jgi:hypothetical protein
MSSKGQVDELFTKTVDDWARFYNDPRPATLNAQNLISRRRFAREMLEAKVSPGSNILDVGCGTGHLAGELMQQTLAWREQCPCQSSWHSGPVHPERSIHQDGRSVGCKLAGQTQHSRSS